MVSQEYESMGRNNLVDYIDALKMSGSDIHSFQSGSFLNIHKSHPISQIPHSTLHIIHRISKPINISSNVQSLTKIIYTSSPPLPLKHIPQILPLQLITRPRHGLHSSYCIAGQPLQNLSRPSSHFRNPTHAVLFVSPDRRKRLR